MSLATLITCSLLSTLTNINNTAAKTDTLGNIINAHDGNVIYSDKDSMYYWVGTSYTLCNMNRSTECKATPNITMINIPFAPHCGWTNNDFAVYSSKDLNSWTLLNPSAIPSHQRPNGIYFRPKMLFNKKTSKYVLWFNYVTEGLPEFDCPTSWGPVDKNACKSVLGTAESDTPQGPYVIKNLPVIMGSDGWVHGDFGVFTDDDDKAYIAYNTYDHEFDVSIDLLTDDYTNTTKNNSGYFTSHTEAPVMIKTAPNKYLVVTGPLCCFCRGGSTMAVYEAEHPLGPYNITKVDINPEVNKTKISTQQSFALKMNDSTYLWGGDRWQTSVYKAHDFVVWLPLNIGSDRMPKPLVNLPDWDIDA
eukprot:TRINITY_DN21901_c0_g1_i1.p1 TRINITY_DN21901_c0_g1~~TRINITY_DN21901_c0_g1_i1.p1  ORF type:complete len:361 (+),score=63.87 TRINITY_DN21901_c0_g1_i1:106-1188(+)